jgi:hypothetical protein
LEPRVALVIGIVLIAAVIVVIAVVVARQRRKAKLREQFGPEYERAVRAVGPSRAEADLIAREKRVERFPLRELTADERLQFAGEWRSLQSRSVDDPQGAVDEADLMLGRLMQARGYPVSDFEQRAADLSVSHPRVVENYRAAHSIALRQREGKATTEDLRNAMVYYRSLITEILETGPTTRRKAVA